MIRSAGLRRSPGMRRYDRPPRAVHLTVHISAHQVAKTEPHVTNTLAFLKAPHTGTCSTIIIHTQCFLGIPDQAGEEQEKVVLVARQQRSYNIDDDEDLVQVAYLFCRHLQVPHLWNPATWSASLTLEACWSCNNKLVHQWKNTVYSVIFWI